MSNAVAMTGSDSLTLNNHLFADQADGDFGKLTFANDIAAVKTGKNFNSVYAQNLTGEQADLELRLIRGSPDDQFLLNILGQQKSNFAGFPLITDSFVKNIGDGQGNQVLDTYDLSGGIILKNQEATQNVEGEITQSVSMWHLKFATALRTIT